MAEINWYNNIIIIYISSKEKKIKVIPKIT